MDANESLVKETGSFALPEDSSAKINGPPVLLGVVRDNEKFDLCMCNPPFFETMQEAVRNPKTSCSWTPSKMVCAGGEKAFIIYIIDDSVILKESFSFILIHAAFFHASAYLCASLFCIIFIFIPFLRWYTSMVGRKTNLKSLISKLREIGVTTERQLNLSRAKHVDGNLLGLLCLLPGM